MKESVRAFIKKNVLFAAVAALVMAGAMMLPGNVMTAWAETVGDNWTGNVSVEDDNDVINGNVTAADGTKLTISEGKKLTVNGTITVGGGSGTLTVTGCCLAG